MDFQKEIFKQKSISESKINKGMKSYWSISVEKFYEFIFGLIFVLLKEDEEPVWLFGLLISLQTLQNLTFPFDSIVKFFV